MAHKRELRGDTNRWMLIGGLGLWRTAAIEDLAALLATGERFKIACGGDDRSGVDRDWQPRFAGSIDVRVGSRCCFMARLRSTCRSSATRDHSHNSTTTGPSTDQCAAPAPRIELPAH